MLRKNSKKPALRKRELIDAAAALFAERGYEGVAVRDILAAVNGAPGMFYYYFKSKQDIYLAVVAQELETRIGRRCEMLEDPALPFDKKKAVYAEMVREDIGGYLARFDEQSHTITDDACKIWEFVQMLNRMSHAHAAFILQGVQEGKIAQDLGITPDNVQAFSLYTLYGAWGLVYNSRFTDSQETFDVDDALAVRKHLFYR